MSVPVLTTPRLQLRPFVLDDAPALFAYASAPEFSRFVAYESPATLEEARSFLEAVLIPETGEQRVWAICRQGEPAVIGTLQVTHDAPGVATVHYDLSHRWYGQGYATEALRAALDWYVTNVTTITTFLADTTAANIASKRVLAKCGFVETGRELVRWDKFPDPVELFSFQTTRESLLR